MKIIIDKLDFDQAPSDWVAYFENEVQERSVFVAHRGNPTATLYWETFGFKPIPVRALTREEFDQQVADVIARLPKTDNGAADKMARRLLEAAFDENRPVAGETLADSPNFEPSEEAWLAACWIASRQVRAIPLKTTTGD